MAESTEVNLKTYIRHPVVIALIIGGLVLLAVVALLVLLPAGTPGQVVNFNGQAVSLDGAAQVKVQSSHSVTAYDDVTVTVNTVTVTIWMQEPAK
jgi:hypothetical protein